MDAAEGVTDVGGARLERTIGLPAAVALYCGAVLGTGILVLPAIAAERAGPASLVAWIGLSLLSLPMALTFAALARKEPVAGGFSAYVDRAFGRRWGAIAGWLFLAQVPIGTVVAGLIAGAYLAAPLGLGRGGVFALGGAVIAVAYALNFLGLRIAGWTQLAATAGVLLLVVVVLVASVGDVHPAAFHPFVPAGWPAVGGAAAQLFWAFVGWEAITPLAEEFRNPERDLVRASVISVAIVAVIYTALAWVTIGTHAYGGAAGGLPPFARMAATAFGPRALAVVGIAGGVLSLLPINAYVAGTSRLVYALAKKGDLPSWAAALHPRTKVPHRALIALAGSGAIALVVCYLRDLDMGTLLPLSTSSFIATYVLSMAAALKLLKGRNVLFALLGLIGCLAVLACVGALVLWLVAVSLAALTYVGVTNRRRTRRLGQTAVLTGPGLAATGCGRGAARSPRSGRPRPPSR